MGENALLSLATQFFMGADASAMKVPPHLVEDCGDLRLRLDPENADGFVLKRGDWGKVAPFEVATARLKIRPIEAQDLTAFHAIAGQASVARMLVNLDHPLSIEAATDWQHKRRFRGRLGFMVGIFDETETLIGSIGIGGISTSLVYFLDQSVRGKGIGTEAVAGFLDYAIQRFGLVEIFAGVFADNPASRHLLEKLGFVVKGEIPFQSPARMAEDLIWEMTWAKPVTVA